MQFKSDSMEKENGILSPLWSFSKSENRKIIEKLKSERMLFEKEMSRFGFYGEKFNLIVKTHVCKHAFLFQCKETGKAIER